MVGLLQKYELKNFFLSDIKRSQIWECSGSVVECLTRDRGVMPVLLQFIYIEKTWVSRIDKCRSEKKGYLEGF